MRAVKNWSPVSRDTLAWLMLHLRRIHTNPVSYTTKKDLATVFAPIIGAFDDNYWKN